MPRNRIKINDLEPFVCETNDSILSAVENSGLSIEYSCRVGRCNSCKIKVLKGETEKSSPELGLSQADVDAGWILSCVRKPKSDLHLEVNNMALFPRIEPSNFISKIDDLVFLNKEVLLLTLRFPPTSNFLFRSGQYLNLTAPSGITRSYSIANSDFSDHRLKLIVRRNKNGLMSDFLFNEARKNDVLKVRGPLGTMGIVPNGIKDYVFVCTGTGIAPVLSMLEQQKINRQLGLNIGRSTVIWGNRYKEDFFIQQYVRDLADQTQLVCSRDTDLNNYKSGYVTKYLEACIDNPKSTQVMACGSPAMVEDVEKMLSKHISNGLILLRDSFTTS